MQDKASEPVYGVAFHSPLDVDYVKPVGYTATLSPTVKADLLYAKEYFPNHEASVQLVFQSLAELLNQGIRIILDVSAKGQIVPIKSDQIDKVLSVSTKPRGAPKPVKIGASVASIKGVVVKKPTVPSMQPTKKPTKPTPVAARPKVTMKAKKTKGANF